MPSGVGTLLDLLAPGQTFLVHCMVSKAYMCRAQQDIQSTVKSTGTTFSDARLAR